MMGYQLFEQGRYTQAKTVFQGLCALDTKEGYYRTALGAVYLAEDDLENAERALNAAIELNPKEIASFVNRGEVYLRQGKIVEAAQDFKRAVELDPDKKDPVSHRARLLAAAAVETIRAAQRQSEGQGKPKPAAPQAKAASGTHPATRPAGSDNKKK